MVNACPALKLILSITVALAVGAGLAAQPSGGWLRRPAHSQRQGLHRGGSATFAQAVAVRGNTIAAVGTTQEIGRLRGPKTEVVDARRRRGPARLQRRAHAHVERRVGDGHTSSSAARARSTRCSGGFARSRRRTPIGPGFKDAAGATSRFPAACRRAQQLDAAVPDRPAVMRCYDGHSIWVNSKALALAGHHEEHARPAERHHRPRSENRRADRPAQGVAGVVAGDAARPEADARRTASRAEGGDGRGAEVRRHQRHRRRRQSGGLRGLRGAAPRRRAGRARVLLTAGHAQLQREGRRPVRRDLEGASRHADAENRDHQDVHGRGDRDQHRVHDRALRERAGPPASRTTAAKTSTASSRCWTGAAGRSWCTGSATARCAWCSTASSAPRR